MIGDSDNVFAVIVSAETFELIDAGGNVVAQFGSLPIEPILWPPLPRYGIDMAHLDPGVLNSSLGWTVSTPANTTEDSQAVGLIGPADPGDPTRLEAAQLVLSRRSNPPSASPDLSSFLLSAGRAPGSGLPIAAVSGTGTPTDSRIILSANNINLGAGINLEIGAGVPAYVMTAMGTVNASGQNFYNAVGVTPFVLIPGLQLTINGCLAGDLIDVEIIVDIRFTAPPPATLISGYVQAFLFVNAVQFGAVSPYRWTELQPAGAAAATDGGTYSGRYTYQVPANGNYTFEARSSANLTFAAVGTSATIGAAHSSLTCTRFRTHV